MRSGRRRSRGATSPASASCARSGACTRRAPWPLTCSGYAGTDNRGLAGLELQLERVLGGRDGSETFVKDPVRTRAQRRRVDPGAAGTRRVPHDRPHDPGERRVRARVDGVAVGRRPGDGGRARRAVAAASSRWPSRQASTRTLYARTPADRHRNVAVTDTFEPGSTFKLVTVAAALSEGLVNESSPFTLPYGIQVADRVVHDAEPRGTETMTVAQILARSSNVGAITLAQLLGPAAPRPLDRSLRVREADGNRLPGRDARHRAAGRALVRLDDRQRPYRPGHRGDGRADGSGVRGGRQRRHVDRAAPRRPRERRRAREAGAPARALCADRRSGAADARERRARGDRHARRRARATRSPARRGPRPSRIP